MRITQSMLSNNMMNNLSASYSKLNTYMDQLSSGKKINRPSDDPVIAMKGMGYRTQVTEVEQFKRNTNEAHNWMDNSDAALDKATKSLQKMRELAVQASNDTYDAEERQNIKEEVGQLKQHLADIANTNVNGHYIFNGTATDTEPVKVNDQGDVTAYPENDDSVRVEVSKGTKLKTNVDATELFGDETFSNIQNFMTALDDNDQSDIEDSVNAIDDSIGNVINARADLGARMNRLELVENRLEQQEISAKKMMSENEDADLEKVITELTTHESVHQAALSAGSRMIQPTLMDFLR